MVFRLQTIGFQDGIYFSKDEFILLKSLQHGQSFKHKVGDNMSKSLLLNETLKTHHPAAFYALTELGRKLYFPTGVPHQASEAKNSHINATIGQCTDDLGRAMPPGNVTAHPGY